MKQHFQQIDVTKGLAIISVLLLHSLSRNQLLQSYAVYHIWQAVPLFMILMGLNLGLSIHAKEQFWRQLYTRKYFTKKAVRIFAPFLVIFVLSALIGYVWERLSDRDVLEFSGFTWVGVLPVTGRGNYFITLLLQSVLLLPIIGYAFSSRPVLTTIVLLLLEAAFQLWAAQFGYFDKNNYLYDAAFPRYFSAVAYGLWLSRLFLQPARWRHLILLAALAMVAAVCLYWLTYTKTDITYLLRPEWESQQVLTFGYAAFIIWLAIKILPPYSDAPPLRVLAEAGRASYHIFLVQVVYFGLAQQDLPLWVNLMVCLLLGYLFFRFEKPILAFALSPILYFSR